MEDWVDGLIKNDDKVRRIRKQYAAHDIWVVIRDFFIGESKERPQEVSFSEIVSSILMKDSTDRDVLEASRNLLEQHRMQENTKARRRLERWATWIISCYLLAVLLLVIVNGVISVVHSNTEFITSKIMVVILSTTTINIIGLGLIVLRGHFPQNKDKE